MIKQVSKLEFYTLSAIVEETIQVDTRIEEGHGIHVFEDIELISKRLEELKIVVGDVEIDILNRLTNEEINTLLSEV